jgi:hypothetical protein
MAEASTLIRTSPGPGSGTGTSRISTTSGPPNSSNTAARMVWLLGIASPPPRVRESAVVYWIPEDPHNRLDPPGVHSA